MHHLRSFILILAATALTCTGLWFGTSRTEKYCVSVDLDPAENFVTFTLLTLVKQRNLLGQRDRLVAFDPANCNDNPTLMFEAEAVKQCLVNPVEDGLDCDYPVNLNKGIPATP